MSFEGLFSYSLSLLPQQLGCVIFVLNVTMALEGWNAGSVAIPLLSGTQICLEKGMHQCTVTLLGVKVLGIKDQTASKSLLQDTQAGSYYIQEKLDLRERGGGSHNSISPQDFTESSVVTSVSGYGPQHIIFLITLSLGSLSQGSPCRHSNYKKETLYNFALHRSLVRVAKPSHSAVTLHTPDQSR